MFFTRKDKPHDMEQLKHAVTDFGPLPKAQPRPSAPPSSYPPPEPLYEPELPKDHAGASLFVKVDKYREILTHVQEMKLFLSGTKQLFSIITEVESIRNDAVKILRASISRFEKSLVQVDSELLRPKGLNMGEFSHGDADVRHIEDSLSNLQQQLKDLKNELQTMR